MSDKKRNITLTVIASLAFAALFTGLYVAQHLNKPKKIDVSQFHGTVLEKPRDIIAFQLQGVDGQPFDNQHMKGQWTMVFFGFTNCGYLCPTTMAELGKMYRLLEQHQVKPLPKIVMVSIDPQRDNLEKLKSYVVAFNPQFYGARGDEADIKKLTQELGIAYINSTSADNSDSGNYQIDHSGTVMLFNPNGQLNAFFTTPHQADLIAKDYELLVKQ